MEQQPGTPGQKRMQVGQHANETLSVTNIRINTAAQIDFVYNTPLEDWMDAEQRAEIGRLKAIAMTKFEEAGIFAIKAVTACRPPVTLEKTPVHLLLEEAMQREDAKMSHVEMGIGTYMVLCKETMNNMDISRPVPVYKGILSIYPNPQRPEGSFFFSQEAPAWVRSK